MVFDVKRMITITPQEKSSVTLTFEHMTQTLPTC